MPAPCRAETQKFRDCLREKRSSGRNCDHLAKSLEDCRCRWRKENHVHTQFDGTRILPPAHCVPLNDNVQSCLKWRKGDQSKCREAIEALKECMAEAPGVVARPTALDKVWERTRD